MKRMALILMVLMATQTGTARVFAQEADDLPAPEQQAMSDTVQFALENNKSNQSANWVNPDTGNSGGITPVRTFASAQGQPCREFVSTIIIGGQEQQGYGTACRQADGSWRIVSDEPAAAREPPPPQAGYYINNPPPVYYYYPPDLYYPYHIFLSFGYIHRGGYVFRGTYFTDGLALHLRYPFHIRERIFIPPHDRARYHRLRGWWEYREPARGRMHAPFQHKDQEEWRDRDRDNKPWRGHRH